MHLPKDSHYFLCIFLLPFAAQVMTGPEPGDAFTIAPMQHAPRLPPAWIYTPKHHVSPFSHALRTSY
jgi:hypothetical protein